MAHPDPAVRPPAASGEGMFPLTGPNSRGSSPATVRLRLLPVPATERPSLAECSASSGRDAALHSGVGVEDGLAVFMANQFDRDSVLDVATHEPAV
jgi:hypothetical protein